MRMDSRILAIVLFIGISLFLIPQPSSAGYTGPWYDIGACPQRYNVTITETSDTDINNYFVTNISINLTDIGFNHSILVVNSSNTSIPFKLYDAMNGTRNATIGFNVTLSANASDDWSIYNCTGLPSRTTYNISNWAGGTDFDADDVDDIFYEWDAATGTANVSDNWYAKAGDIGNHSVEFQTDAAKWLNLSHKITQGSTEFWMKVPGNAFGDLVGFYNGNGGTGGILMNILDDNMRYRDGAGYVNITSTSSGQIYHFSFQWDCTDETYNVTIYNSTWTFTANAIAFWNSVAYMSWIKIGTPSEVSYIDNIIARPGTVYPEPSAYIGRLEPYSISACDDTHTETLITFQALNETDDFGAVNATMDMQFTFEIDGHSYAYNNSITNETYHLCTNSPLIDGTIDGQVQYSNGSYYTRNYFFDDDVLNSTTQILNLYMIDTVDGTALTMTVQDTEGNAEEGVYISIQRWYPGLNDYRTVARPRSDENGETLTYVDFYDVYYRFILEQGGVIVHSTDIMLITSSELDFTIEPSLAGEFYQYYNLIGKTCSYNNDTRILTCIVNDGSGLMTRSCLNVTLVNGTFYQQICGNCSSATSATHTCYLSENATYTYSLYAQMSLNPDDLIVLDQDWVDLVISIAATFGLMGVFMATMFIATSSLVGAYYPPVGVILLLVSLGFCMWFGILDITMSMFTGIGLVGMLIIYKFMS